MAVRRWYVDASGSPVDWATQVVNGVPLGPILEVIELDPALPPVRTLWAAEGMSLSSELVGAAQTVASVDPVPPERPPIPPFGSVAGGAGISAYSATKAYGANELVLYAERLFRALTSTTGNAPRTDGSADAFWTEVSPTAPALRRTWQFTRSGTLAVATGVHRLTNRTGATIVLGSVHSAVGTAPAGAAVNVALIKNGAAVTGAAPSIAAGANAGEALGAFSWEAGAYLTVNITQIGSTTPGADLVVTLTEA